MAEIKEGTLVQQFIAMRPVNHETVLHGLAGRATNAPILDVSPSVTPRQADVVRPDPRGCDWRRAPKHLRESCTAAAFEIPRLDPPDLRFDALCLQSCAFLCKLIPHP